MIWNCCNQVDPLQSKPSAKTAFSEDSWQADLARLLSCPVGSGLGAAVLLHCQFASCASSRLDWTVRSLCTGPGAAMPRADTHLPEGVAAIDQLVGAPHETTLKAALHTWFISCQTVPV